MGKAVVFCIALMAAIPILMGIVIFAPVFIPLALLCVFLESRDA